MATQPLSNGALDAGVQAHKQAQLTGDSHEQIVRETIEAVDAVREREAAERLADMHPNGLFPA